MKTKLTLIIDSEPNDGKPWKWDFTDLLAVNSASVEDYKVLENDDGPITMSAFYVDKKER